MGIELSRKAYTMAIRYLDTFVRVVGEEINNALAFLGEKCVIKVRDRTGEDSWFDQTGNLRSSIGYAVYNDGRKVIESTFQQVLNGSEGTVEGRKLIDELAKKYSETYALVLVAGMNYAADVEAMENKDVLASTELWARSKVDRHLELAKTKALLKMRTIKL